MSDFYELEEAKLATEQQWYVKSVISGFKFLDRNAQIAEPVFGTTNQHLYFDSEYEALSAACEYYHAALKPFPYIDDLVRVEALYKKGVQESCEEDLSVIESQHMRFD